LLISVEGEARYRFAKTEETMGKGLHGCATTTLEVRRAIQVSQESLRALAKRYGITQNTVVKWKKRDFVADIPPGPKSPSNKA
jgi:hypothetical protein